MLMARSGSTVRVHYTGRLPDGTLLHSSRGGEPVRFTLGQGEVLPGLEEAVEGMSPGESKTVWMTPDQAYGPHRDDLVLTVNKERFPDHIDPEPGQRLRMRRQGEPTVIVTVVDVWGEDVLLDANHPLAGHDVTFELELLDITPTADHREAS